MSFGCASCILAIEECLFGELLAYLLIPRKTDGHLVRRAHHAYLPFNVVFLCNLCILALFTFVLYKNFECDVYMKDSCVLAVSTFALYKNRKCAMCA